MLLGLRKRRAPAGQGLAKEFQGPEDLTGILGKRLLQG
jgi:hypothetical protein